MMSWTLFSCLWLDGKAILKTYILSSQRDFRYKANFGGLIKNFTFTLPNIIKKTKCRTGKKQGVKIRALILS